ncbi:MAG: alpha/beta hydrolase [Microcoleus sp. SIO2G3]|nr:alpha/beta hydrolase [Microcoleus sp. SIO2G3]
MAYVSIRGVDHYYEWVTTEGQPSGKPVMVFMHGWGGSDRYWESTAQALKSQFDCLLYDLRGFGRSPLTKPIPDEVKAIGYELETYAEDLALLLNALGIEKIVLNAHSTGSSIALFFLNLYPERVDRGILTCGGIFEYDEKAFKAFYKFGGYVVAFRPKWLSQIPFVDRIFMARFLHRSIPKRDRQAFLEDFLVADYDAALGTIYTAVSERAVEVMPKEFAQLAVPTLLISGQYDQIIPAEMGRQAAALNAIVEHIVMPDTSHFPMLEDPDTYLQHVRRFLAIEPAAV